MGNYYGISLAGHYWCCANLDISSVGAILTAEHTELLPDHITAPKILKTFDQTVSLSRHLDQTRPDQAGPASAFFNKVEGDVCNSVAQVIRNANLYGYFKEYIDSANAGAVTLGLTHPYGVSRAARRAFPALVNLEPIDRTRELPNERVSAIHPTSPTSVARVCALESPFAVALELFAQRRVSAPALIAALTEVAEGTEVTVIRLTIEGPTLKLSAVDYFVVAVHTPAAYAAISKSRIQRSLVPGFAISVIHSSEQTKSCAAALAQSLNALTSAVPAVCGFEPAGIAAGAARYAALCSNEEVGTVLQDDRVQKIEFASIAPYPIGLCGQNSRGEVVWCPVVEAGEPLAGSNRHSIHFAGDRLIPTRMLLAESLQPERYRGEWATDAKLLRWYAEVPVDVPRETHEGSIEIVIESSTDCWQYGWSDPFIRGTFVPNVS